MTKDIFKKILILFVTAVLLRTTYVFFSSRGQDEIYGDAKEYYSYAESLLLDRNYMCYDGRKAARTPGYPIFLWMLNVIGFKSIQSIQAIQILLASMVCIIIYFFLRNFMEENWAYAGSWLTVFYFDLLKSPARILSETVYVFMIAMFFFFLNKYKAARLSKILIPGLLLGYACLIRPECYLFGATIPAYIFLVGKNRTAFFRAAVFSVALASVIAPWVIRNYLVLGKPILTTTTAGFNLYVGIGFTLEKINKTFSLRTELTGINELDRNSQYLDLTKQLYRKAGLNTLIKVILFNASVLFYPFHPYYDPTLFFLLPLWIYGIKTAFSKKELFPVLIFLITSALAYIFFGSTVARYREPLAIGLTIIAANGIYEIQKRIGKPLFMKTMAGWTVVNSVVWVLSPYLRQFLLYLKEIICR